MHSNRRMITAFITLAVGMMTLFTGAPRQMQITEAAAASAIMLYPPPSVDQSQVKLTFEYTAAKGGTYQVRLKIKPSGTSVYRFATLGQTTITAAAAGKKTYQLTWNKQADKLTPGKAVDLMLIITNSGGKAESFELRNYKPDTKANVRNGIDNYLIYYGSWTDALVNKVKTQYKLVILDTRTGITPSQVARLRAGADAHNAADDVLVFGYISVGEDARTVGLTAEQMKKDKRFVLDGTGPAVDPRSGAPYANGGPLTGAINPAGKLTNGGFAPYYLNDNDVTNGSRKNSPDFNASFNGAFVNIGSPVWYTVLSNMTLKQDKVSGIRELLTTDYGAAFGLDGLFLDTLDTAAPNSYTDSSSWNQSEFEWTAPGVQSFVRKLSSQYPRSLLIGNRGLFFYNPDLAMYNYSLRAYVDFVMFESYRLNSGQSEYYNAAFFADNKYNVAQKLLAEADRPDGFRVLSLGYAEGPEGSKLQQALRAGTDYKQLLTSDIEEAARQLGMVHYISNASLTDVNAYVQKHLVKTAKAPVWGSTQTPLFGKPYEKPRAGVQQAFFRNGKLVVQWDVAHSQARPVQYSLYLKEGEPFDFSRELKGQSGVYIDSLAPEAPADYAGAGDRSNRFPYQASVGELDSAKTYYVVIRARNAQGLYDKNEQMLQVNSQPDASN